jgi:chromosome partitioning protein
MVSFIGEGLRRMVGGEPTLRPGDRAAAVVSVCAQKGGVGKTTTAVNLACALARFHGRKVLLVDMDSQGHVASSLYKVVYGGAASSLSDVLLGRKRDLMEIVVPAAVERLHVTPSDKALNETEGVIATRIGKEFLLRQALRTARTHFDVVLLDCPPNLGNLTLNALLASSWALVPSDMSILSLEGVRDLVETIETVGERLGHDVRLLGLVRTRVDGRNRQMNETIQRVLERDYGPLVFGTAIPVNTSIAKSQLEGRPIFDHDGESTGAQAYRALADEVVRRLGLPPCVVSAAP